MGIIGIGEEIVILDRIGRSLLANSLNIGTGCGILDGHSEFRTSIDVADQLIHILIPHAGVGVLEVFSQSVQQVVGSVVIGHGLEVLHELVGTDIDVVVLQSRIVLDGLVPAHIVEAEPWRGTVVVIVDVGEHEGALIASVLQGAPHHLHSLIIKTLFFVLIVDSSEEESLESHLTEESGGRGVMSEGVNMPCHLRHVVERILEPPQSHSHLVHEVLVVHIGLIGHTPSSIDKLDLPIRHQRLHLLSLSIRGLVPPTVEEGHLDDAELVFGMFGQFRDDSVDGVLHSCKLGTHISSVEVVVDSLEPPHIVVGVRDEVDSECGIGGVGLVVVLLHHLLVVETQAAVGGSEKGYQQDEDDWISF